jgi:N-acetylglutamate synthase-like GNAT family acetyltransferase
VAIGDAAIVVRAAEAADLGPVVELLDELGYPSSAEAVGESMEALRRDPASWLWVAVDRGEVVGLVGLHVMPLLERGPFARMTALVVGERARRRGIGRALIERMEEQAREEGCERIELSSADRRHDAHAFYRRVGFQEASRRFLKHL